MVEWSEWLDDAEKWPNNLAIEPSAATEGEGKRYEKSYSRHKSSENQTA